MSKSTVSASIVREWGRANESLVPEAGRLCLNPNARGRLHPDLRAAYAKAHKGKTYVEKVAESATVTVPVTVLNKNGGKAVVQRTITTAEAREALGQFTKDGDKVTYQKGRLSIKALSDVLSQAYAAEVADQFTKLA